jgi:hypothetical protein
MKNIKYHIIIILLSLSGSLTFSQDNINITEGGDTTICGKIIILDAIWVNEGMVKADISILEKQNSKPITGGYKKGDEITISSETGCTYYVYSVTKFGNSNSKGSVTLSKTAPDIIPEVYDNYISVSEGASFKVGSYDWYVSSISNVGGKTNANISITQNTALIDNLVLTNGDLVWLGERLYKVESIQKRSEFIKTDPERIYEPLPEKIEFKIVKEFLPE